MVFYQSKRKVTNAATLPLFNFSFLSGESGVFYVNLFPYFISSEMEVSLRHCYIFNTFSAFGLFLGACRMLSALTNDCICELN